MILIRMIRKNLPGERLFELSLKDSEMEDQEAKNSIGSRMGTGKDIKVYKSGHTQGSMALDTVVCGPGTPGQGRQGADHAMNTTRMSDCR